MVVPEVSIILSNRLF